MSQGKRADTSLGPRDCPNGKPRKATMKRGGLRMFGVLFVFVFCFYEQAGGVRSG